MRGKVITAWIAGAVAIAGLASLAIWQPWQRGRVAFPGTAIVPSDPALAQIRGEVSRAQARATALDREARAATLASECATIAAAATGARVQQAEAALAAADAELVLVRGQRLALDRSLAHEREPVLRLLAGLQAHVRRPALLALLQPGSMEDAVRLRAVIAAIGPQIDARTRGLRAALARSETLEREAGRIAARRRSLQDDLRARREELAALSAAERIKARRAAGAADREAERAYIIAQQSRDLPTLVRRLGDRTDAAAAPTRRSPRPAAGAPAFQAPALGEIVAGFAAGDAGITIAARPGALVVAPAAGRVAFAGPYRGYGSIVILEHAGGWTSLITGLAAGQVAVGQELVAGSPLGQAPTASPRIGMELRRDGKRMNPLDQLH